MNRTNSLVALATVVLMVGCVPTQGGGAIELTEAHVCDLKVGELFQHANMSVDVTYEVTLNGTGTLQACRRTTDRDFGIPHEEVVSCLSRWQFSGRTDNEAVKVTFHWDHYVGWTDISIVGDSLEQKLVLKRRYR